MQGIAASVILLFLSGVFLLASAQESCFNTGNLRMFSGAQVAVYGDLVNNGAISDNLGTVYFPGDSTQRIEGTNPLELYNVTVINSENVELSTELSIRNTLSLEDGSLFTGDSLILISDAANTARIVEIINGTVSGDITMQRYIDAGSTNWRFLTFAVSGKDLESFDDDFTTSGIPGTDYPNWPSASNPWPSFYFYDEALGITFDDGYYVPSSTAEVVGVGQGVWAWCGDTLTGTQPFTIDVKGPANQGNINLPVSYTASAGDDEIDGWNMVANPYPCTIDWNASDWTKSNIDDAIYIWNPDIAQYASYVAGVGTNSGSNFVASSQAFWVHANNSSPTLTITEKCKVDQDQQFLKSGIQPVQLLRLKLTTNNAAAWDETVVRYTNDATETFDRAYDAKKLAPQDVSSPWIASVSGGTDYSINALPVSNTLSQTDFKIVLPNPGNCTVAATDLTAVADMACVLIKDLKTGHITDLKADSSYSFTHLANIHQPRLRLFVSPYPQIEELNPLCFDGADGMIVGGYGLADSTLFTWIGATGDTIRQFKAFNADTLAGIGAGTYIVSYGDVSGNCPEFADTITLTEPDPILANANITPPSCDTCCDGSISLDVSGGSGTYTYMWETPNSGSNAVVSGLCKGSVSVLIIDESQCEQRFEFTTGVLDVADLDNSLVYIYPNPAGGLVRVESEFPLYNARLTDVFGKEVARMGQNIYPDEHGGWLELTTLPKGIYFLTISDRSYKIIKQ